jgi:CRISPR-associated protein Csm3
MQQLTNIHRIKGTIELLTGLHIGAGNEEVHIGGIDNAVIKHPHTGQPYIPGSSLKGKMRSLLEWRAGVVGIAKGKPVSVDMLEHNDLSATQKQQAEIIIRLFGMAGDTQNDKKAAEIGITRLSFWDCALNADWEKKVTDNNWLYTEAKSENTIDRITGVTTIGGLRQTERVPAGASFDFNLSLKVLSDSENYLDTVLAGLKLLEQDSIGGSGSRGYGKIKFKLEDGELQARLESIDPFKVV